MSLSTLARRVRTFRLLARAARQPEVAELNWARCELAMRQLMRATRRARLLSAA